MFDINPLIGISREIREWVKFRDEKKTADSVEIAAAADALSQAILTTRQHLSSIAKSGKPEIGEPKLVELWQEARSKLWGVSPNLSDRCFAKAEYWVQPEAWPEERVAEYNIGLDTLSEAVRQLRNIE